MSEINKYKWAADYIRDNYILSCDECKSDIECSSLVKNWCKEQNKAFNLAVKMLDIAAMYTSKEPENLKDALDRGELSLNE